MLEFDPKWKSGRLEGEIKAAFSLPDPALRDRMDELSRHWAFSGLTWLWGPQLYFRDRIVYRPFILSHFGTHVWSLWKGERGVPWRLDEWLAQVESQGDIELARRLLAWKIGDAGGWDYKRSSAAFNLEVQRRLVGPEWRRDLRKLECSYCLDEATGLHLLARDPNATGAFVLAHLPGKKMWEKFFQEALKRDPELAWSVYRKQVTAARWLSDVTALKSIDELERHHPERVVGNELGHGFLKLLEQRGREVIPYVMSHLRSVWKPWFWLQRGAYGGMLELARKKGWTDLWTALLRVCAPVAEYNSELRTLLVGNDKAPLLALAGVSREFNLPGLGFAQVKALEESTAVMLYQRHPDLLRGPFRMHLQGRGNARLLRLLLDAHEEELIDFLASRFLSLYKSGEEVEMLYAHFLSLKDTPDFPRRAAAVLGQIPAYSMPGYKQLMRINRLARLLFERSLESYLAHPAAVADLVEAAEIHVQHLAYRVLALPAARALAAQHLSLLLGTLFRPLQRATQMDAIKALGNAAGHDLEAARRVLARAREALALPERFYPLEKLVGLIGQILHRWTELRGAREQPLVYRAS